MRQISIIALWLFLLTSIVFPVPARAQSVDIAVIVNPANPVTNLSLADLRKILRGERHSWPGGIPVKLMASASGSHERLAMLKVAGLSEGNYKQYWTAQVVRGEADGEPLILPSFGMILEAVRAFPGAIALVDARSVRPGMATKVSRIEGCLPGEAGYPLH